MKLIILTLLLTVLLSGCVESDPLAGNTYEGPDGDIIRFFDDGKMHYTKANGVGASGTYFIEDNRVYFNAFFWSGDADIWENGLHSDGEIYVFIDQ